jgi:hypothetical protein
VTPYEERLAGIADEFGAAGQYDAPAEPELADEEAARVERDMTKEW